METSVLARLASFMDFERQLLAQGEHSKFAESSDKKRELQKEFFTAARAREFAIGALCDALDIDRTDVKLKKIAETVLVGDPERARLLNLAVDEYKSAAIRLTESGSRTQELLKKSIHFTDDMIKMIANCGKAPPTYAYNGSLKDNSRASGCGLLQEL